MTETVLPGPLDGYRVVELTVFKQGPLAGAMLGDMGADVIKVEDPNGGDPGRAATQLQPGNVARLEHGDYYFELFNRNKKSVTVNLRVPEGRAVLARLVESADVFLHNHRLAALERLGADYSTLSQKNPRLVYVSALSYGRFGPDRDRPSMDTNMQARAGMMSIAGDPDDPPVHHRGLTDTVGAMTTAFATVAALMVRERFGIGQQVDTSLLSSAMFLQGVTLHEFLYSGMLSPRESRRTRASTNVFQGSDGKWFALSMTQSDRYWPDFCQLVGIQEIEHDPRFSGHDRRVTNGAELTPILDGAFAKRPRDEWLALLQPFDIPCGPVHDHREVMADLQIAANSYLADFYSPSEGKFVKMVDVPVRFSRTPGRLRTPAPKLGFDTDTVLREIAGFGDHEIRSLRDLGAI